MIISPPFATQSFKLPMYNLEYMYNLGWVILCNNNIIKIILLARRAYRHVLIIALRGVRLKDMLKKEIDFLY